jgi:superfamily II DNA/RNA helicase
MQHLKPDMERVTAAMKAAESMSDPKIQLRYQMEMKEMFIKHKVNPFKALVMPFLQMPIFISVFMALRQAHEYLPTFSSGGAYWFTDLSAADPYYILPIINGLIGRQHPVLRALIVLPTRDLALQVAQVISSFTCTSKSNLKVHCFIGGQTSMAEERAQLNATSPDIAVATIGRLVDHLVIGSLDLSYLRWLVVDEADRMLSKSDLDKWSLILQSVPSSTHRLLFSATMTSNPMKLSKLHLTRPLFVSVGTGGLPKSILHKYIVVPNKSMKVRGLIKLLELTFEGGSAELLSPEPSNRCLILCRTAANVDSLSSLLASFYKNSSRVVPAAFSGNMSGKQREKLLSKFAKGSTNCLVSTDVITRGIDIPDIDTVINYDVPSNCTTYIHRAGRTGRANKKGLVVTLAQSNEMRHFRKEILAGNASIKNAMARFPLDFSGLMTHDELEGIVEADGDLLEE